MSRKGHKWSQEQRDRHSMTMGNVALFRMCQSCQRENATTLRRDHRSTWAVCRYCGHEELMVRYTASDEFEALRKKWK